MEAYDSAYQVKVQDMEVEHHFSQIYIATAIDRFSIFKSFYDDCGVIDILPKGFIFRGSKEIISSEHIQNIELVQPKFPICKMALFIIALALLLNSIIIPFALLTIHNNISSVIGFTVIINTIYFIPMIFISVILLLFLRGSRFVLVSYKDSKNKQHKIYFVSRTSGIPIIHNQGTRQLFNILSGKLSTATLD